ncbi:hypothetical protein [Rhodococcus koreensis]|uniref:hypothetical protein n=1 Tax=Rhodococcus koreensis TaxID=99653 RepID=UPI00366EB05C
MASSGGSSSGGSSPVSWSLAAKALAGLLATVLTGVVIAMYLYNSFLVIRDVVASNSAVYEQGEENAEPVDCQVSDLASVGLGWVPSNVVSVEASDKGAMAIDSNGCR